MQNTKYLLGKSSKYVKERYSLFFSLLKSVHVFSRSHFAACIRIRADIDKNSIVGVSCTASFCTRSVHARFIIVSREATRYSGKNRSRHVEWKRGANATRTQRPTKRDGIENHRKVHRENQFSRERVVTDKSAIQCLSH